MSNTKKIQMQTIPLDKEITLKINGHFYRRIVGAYFNYMSKIENERLESMLPHLPKNKIDDIEDEGTKIDAYSLQTLLILIDSTEQAFTDKGFSEMQEFEVPDEESADEPTEDSE